MASVTSSAVSIPSSFTSLKATAGTTPLFTTLRMASSSSSPSLSKFAVKASLKEAGLAAVVAVTASAMLAGSAMAIDIKLGADSGELVFEPKEFTVASGEKITFTNNAGFPHNIVFDEDEIPAGVDASKISMSEEDLLNAPKETYSVTLTEKGTYNFYCSPHQGAGMVGKVTVT